jgi:hypothetical protein
MNRDYCVFRRRSDFDWRRGFHSASEPASHSRVKRVFGWRRWKRCIMSEGGFASPRTSDVLYKRCANHYRREAVARCPECSRTFCRECVTEHDARILCASCLAKILTPVSKTKKRFRHLSRGTAFAFGVLLVWYVFFLVGQILIAIPTKFHEGTVWQDSFLGEP